MSNGEKRNVQKEQTSITFEDYIRFDEKGQVIQSFVNTNPQRNVNPGLTLIRH